jgi:hypothetical protein
MTLVNRPPQIAEILKIILRELPTDMAISVELYISNLEANQRNEPSISDDSFRNPTWLYWQGQKRELRRRERALRKINHYQPRKL